MDEPKSASSTEADRPTIVTQAEKLGIKPGQAVPNVGVVVSTIIFDTDECVVYLDADLNTWWDTEQVITPEIGKALNRVAELESIPLDGLSTSVKLAFRTMVAEGAARALDDEDNASAQLMHDRAEAFIKARLSELARSWYLTTGLVALVLSGIAMTLVWFFVSPPEYVTFGLCLATGALGAAFSLISRIASFPLDPAAGRRLHVLEASARVLAGVVGAFVAFLALNAKIVFPTLVDADAGLAPLLLVSFVAGISERFVPNLVQRVEGLSASDSAGEKSADSPTPLKQAGTAEQASTPKK